VVRAALALGVALFARGAAAQQPTPPAAPPAAPAPPPAAPPPTTPPAATPARPDTAARASIDSVRNAPDSLRTPRVRRDSIQPPLTRAELPVGVTAGPAYRFRGDTILATGAVTLLDLLERVPGVAGFRSGYVASAQTANYNGDFRRVRVFRDGVELDPVDPRNGGVLDLGDVQLWQGDELSVEPTAGELRVFIRTRASRNRTPQTRVDVLTGDDETNVFRGYYGKRWGNGTLLQAAAQQLGTGSRNQRIGGGGDVTSALVRYGWARRNLSADVTLTRLARRRNETLDFSTQQLLLGRFAGRRDEGYVRVGYGDPDSGVWAQAVANALDFRLDSPVRDPADTSTVKPDTTAYRTQYVVAGGFTRWGVRFSATNRLRVFAGRTDNAPALRASFERPWLAVSAYAERSGVDSLRRADVSARLQPLRWLALVGAVSRSDGGGALAGAQTVARAEAALRLGDAWLSGGRIERGAGTFAPPLAYELLAYDLGAGVATRPLASVEPRVGGTVASFRGRFFRDLHADVQGVVWDSAGAFRPRYQGRAELRLRTNWLRRFPTREFGANIAVFDEYRSEMFATFRAGAADAEPVVRRAGPSNQLGALVELRLQSAVISFQIRNALGRQFEYLPGLTAPRALSLYGVRWEFSN
jgi:hypothetical protein